MPIGPATFQPMQTPTADNNPAAVLKAIEVPGRLIEYNCALEMLAMAVRHAATTTGTSNGATRPPVSVPSQIRSSTGCHRPTQIAASKYHSNTNANVSL